MEPVRRLSSVKRRLVSFFAARDVEFLPNILCIHLMWITYSNAFHLLHPVTPFLMEELTKNAGGSSTSYSVAYGYFRSIKHLMSVIGGPIAGHISDTFGKRILLLISLTAGVMHFVGFASAYWLWMMFVAQVPVLFQHVKQSSQTYLVDMSESDKRTIAMGRLSLGSGVATLLSQTAGGLLSTVVGYRGVAVVSAFCVLLAYPLAFSLPTDDSIRQISDGKSTGDESTKKSTATEGEKEPHRIQTKGNEGQPHQEETVKKPKKNFWTLVANRNIQYVMVFMLLWRGGSSLLISMERIIYKEELDLSATQLGIMSSLLGIVRVASTGLFVPWLSSKFSETSILSMGCIGSILCLYGFTLSRTMIVFLFIAKMLTQSLTRVVFVSLITSYCEDDQLGSAIGLSHSIMSLTGIISPIAGGIIYHKYGTTTLAGLAIGISSVGWVYWIVLNAFKPTVAAGTKEVAVINNDTLPGSPTSSMSRL